MAPLLSDHELIFINRLVYHFEPVQRGDVVVFSYPLDRTKSFIKCIVALPGETAEIRQGVVYVNGDPLPEPYVPPQYEDLTDFGPIRDESYFAFEWFCLHMATKASRSSITYIMDWSAQNEHSAGAAHIRANGRNDEIICIGNLCTAPGKTMETRAWFIRLRVLTRRAHRVYGLS